jgi:seryl-tRNA(Sec) selenium transferase
MDQKISDALAFANYRLTLQTHRQNILARTEAALLVNHQNAIFRASTEMIAFVSTLAARQVPVYVDDSNGTTHLIDDPAGFLDALVSAHVAAYSLKHQEQQKLKSARTSSKIVGM